MPLNPNILALLRQTQTSGNSQPTDQGVNPNLEMILQAMGMMPRQLDLQGRPILSGVKNPSTMDQHYARQSNPEAMKDRYSSPTFAMGPNDPNRMAPATKLPGQGQIVAHQPISGLPGQVGPAYGTQMTPINMSPSADENAAMDAVRQQYRKTMFPAKTQTVSPSAVLQGQMPTAPQTQQRQAPQTPGVRVLPPAPAQPSVPTGTMDTWAQQMPQNPPQQNPMDVWASQMPQNPPVASQAPVVPSLTNGNPVLHPLQQQGAAFMQQYPLLSQAVPGVTYPLTIPTSDGMMSPGQRILMEHQRRQEDIRRNRNMFSNLR